MSHFLEYLKSGASGYTLPPHVTISGAHPTNHIQPQLSHRSSSFGLERVPPVRVEFGDGPVPPSRRVGEGNVVEAEMNATPDNCKSQLMTHPSRCARRSSVGGKADPFWDDLEALILDRLLPQLVQLTKNNRSLQLQP